MDLSMENKGPTLLVGRLNMSMGQGNRDKLAVHSLGNGQLDTTKNCEISHRRDRKRRKYHSKGNLCVFTMAYHEVFHILSCWHSGNNAARNRCGINDQASTSQQLQIYHKIRCCMHVAWWKRFTCFGIIVLPFFLILGSFTQIKWLSRQRLMPWSCLTLMGLHEVFCQHLCKTALACTCSWCDSMESADTLDPSYLTVLSSIFEWTHKELSRD